MWALLVNSWPSVAEFSFRPRSLDFDVDQLPLWIDIKFKEHDEDFTYNIRCSNLERSRTMRSLYDIDDSLIFTCTNQGMFNWLNLILNEGIGFTDRFSDQITDRWQPPWLHRKGVTKMNRSLSNPHCLNQRLVNLTSSLYRNVGLKLRNRWWRCWCWETGCGTFR